MNSIGTGEQQVKNLLTHLRRANSDVILGPVRLGHKQSEFAQLWYFVCVSADADGNVSYDALTADEYEFTEELRGAVISGLTDGSPRLIHDVDDEKALAQLAAATWPSARTQAVLDSVQQELSEKQKRSASRK